MLAYGSCSGVLKPCQYFHPVQSKWSFMAYRGIYLLILPQILFRHYTPRCFLTHSWHTHTPKLTFRMHHEPSETSLLISPSPKHTGTYIFKDVPPNTSGLIKSDSWQTAVCLCLAVSNQRLPPLVLMCKLQSSQMGSCYQHGIKTQRR